MFSTITSGLKLGNKLSDEHNINVSGSEDPTFCRHQMQGKTQVTSGITSGITGTTPKRAIDQRLHDRYKRQHSVHEGTFVASSYLEKLQVVMGNFGMDNNMSNYLAQLFNSLNALARRPDDVGLIQGVLKDAQTLTQSINNVSNTIQSQRTEADLSVYNEIQDLKGKLREYARVNTEIKRLFGAGQKPLDLQSKRDALAYDISKYLPITECNERNGGKTLYYQGHVLVHNEFIADITFRHTSYISAESTNLSGVSIERCDVTEELRRGGSGTIANLLKLRDLTLTNFQEEIDEFTFVLRERMNKYHNNGSSYASQPSKTGTQVLENGAGTALVNPQGNMRFATVDNQTKKFVEAIDVDLSTCATVQDVMDAINASNTMTASITQEGFFKLESRNPDQYGVSLVDLDPPSGMDTTDGRTISLSYFLGLQDLFVTPGFKNGEHTPGIAQVIALNPYYTTVDPGFFESGILSKEVATPPNPPAPGIPLTDKVALAESNATTVQLMQNLAEEHLEFERAGFLPRFEGEMLLSYVQNLLEDFAVQTDKANQSLETEQYLFSDLETAVRNFSQPNIQEEIQQLLFCQNYMNALNAVFSVLRDNSDMISNLLKRR